MKAKEEERIRKKLLEEIASGNKPDAPYNKNIGQRARRAAGSGVKSNRKHMVKGYNW